MPTFKPAALRQIAGKAPQCSSPNLFSQQAAMKKEKRVRYLSSPIQCRRQPTSGCPALQWACLPATDKQKYCTARICRLRARAPGFTGSFIPPKLQHERGDVLPLPVNDAVLIKKSALLMTGAELYLCGRANPSGGSWKDRIPTAENKSCSCRLSASHQRKKWVSEELFQGPGLQFTRVKADHTQPLAGIDTSGAELGRAECPVLVKSV